jgi:tripartite-type tricarboxylate transporter receptor subunit TctC
MLPLARRGCLLAVLAAPGAFAQEPAFPSRAVTLVVPYAPGGPGDIIGRATAEAMRRQLSQPVVVENRVGAGGMIGTRAVGGSRPDGYTMLLGSAGPLVIAPSANPAAEDPLRSLQPVGLVSDSPQMLAINAALPARTMAEFVELARARPDGFNMGSAGIGTTPHLAMELLKGAAGIQLEHIPYRGTGAAIPDLVAGKIDGLFGDIAALLPLVNDGKIRALAITGAVRSPLAPTIPTTTEAGFPRQQTANWQALLVAAGTPAPVVRRLSEALQGAQADETFLTNLARQGAFPAASSPDHLRDLLARERETWGPIIRAIGLKLD